MALGTIERIWGNICGAPLNRLLHCLCAHRRLQPGGGTPLSSLSSRETTRLFTGGPFITALAEDLNISQGPE